MLKIYRLFRVILQKIIRIYPFYSGAGKFSNVRIARKCFNDNSLQNFTKLKNGLTIYIPKNEFVGRVIYYSGDHDKKITWVCNKILNAGDTFLDIGAHCGVVSLFASKIVGENGIVHAFEPQKELADLLIKSKMVNMLQNISIHNVGLSDEDRESKIFVPLDNRGQASISRKYQGGGDYQSIDLRNTSKYLDKLKLEKIDLIKIDVEGHEETVIKGGEKFFIKISPKAILFEYNDLEKPFWDNYIIKWLSKNNYKLFEIPRAYYRMYLRELQINTPPSVESNDFLALKDTSIYNRLKKHII